MQKYFDIRDQLVVPCDGPDDASIHVFIDPDEREKRLLVEQFQVDEHTLQSALDPDELSRLEFEPSHAAAVFKRPRNYSGPDQLLFKVASTGVFLFKERLVIVVSDDIPLFDRRHFRRVTRLPEVMLKVIYGAIYHFLEHLRVINMICDEVEAKINEAMENRYLINLFALEKSMVYYLNAIHSNGVLIDRIKNAAAKIGLTVEETEFLDDMAIDNSQCYKQADIYSNILASLMDARASIVGNNLNVLMKRLTIITLAIMLPTFIVSAFSMNIDLPFDRSHPAAFWSVMAFAGVSVAGFWIYMKKRNW